MAPFVSADGAGVGALAGGSSDGLRIWLRLFCRLEERSIDSTFILRPFVNPAVDSEMVRAVPLRLGLC